MINEEFIFQESQELAKQKNEQGKLEDIFFQDLKSDVIELLKNAALIHNFIRFYAWTNNPQDIKSLAIFISVLELNFPEKDLLEYMGFNSLGLLKKVTDHNALDFYNYLRANIYTFDIIKIYNDMICEGPNKDKKRSEITVLDIVQNAYTLNQNKYFQQILKDFMGNLAQKEFKDIYKMYLENEERKQKIKNVQAYLELMRNANNYNYQLVIGSLKIRKVFEDIPDSPAFYYSVLLTILYFDEKIKTFFERRNFGYGTILNQKGITAQVVKEALEKVVDYTLYDGLFLNYFGNPLDTQIPKIDIKQMLFDQEFSLILHELLEDTYEILKREVQKGVFYENSLTISERMKLLKDINTTPLTVNDWPSLVNFGKPLEFHAQFFAKEIPELTLKTQNNNAVTIIKEIIAKFSLSKKTKKFNYIAKLFRPTENEDIAVEELLNELQQEVRENIKTLSVEVLTYDQIRKYLDLYRQKVYEHYKALKGFQLELTTQKDLPIDDDYFYGQILANQTMANVISDKVNRYEATNLLLKQQLMTINQAIYNHFMTINTLEMIKDDLFPLISSSIILANGNQREKQALILAQNVFSLIQSLLTKNEAEVKENMQSLQLLTISDETLQKINEDIDLYMDNLGKLNRLNDLVLNLKR